MKKLLLIISFCAPLLSNAQNLVQNFGFETVGTAPNVFQNWNNQATGSNINRDVTNFISGASSVRFGGGTTAFLTSDEITLEEGKTYRVGFTGRIQSAAGPAGGAAAPVNSRLFVNFQYWNGTAWAAFSPTAAERPTVTTSNNETVFVDYLISSGRTRTRLVFDKNSGIAYADDVIVQDVTTLPITLSSLVGQANNYGVKLNWTTASETNNQYFEILRAGEDKNFVSIGRINGSRNSSTSKSYSFDDFNPLTGNNYYQLKQIDFDGKSTSFTPIAVNFGLSSNKISLLSSSDMAVTVSVSSATDKEANISYVGLDGRIIYQQKTYLKAGLNTVTLPVNKSVGNIGIISLSANKEQQSIKISR
jgi:hypothetical protein